MLTQPRQKPKQRDDGGDSWSGTSRKPKSGHSGFKQLKNERDYLRAEFEKLKKVPYLEDRNCYLEDALRIELGNVERVRRSANTMQSAMDNREAFLGVQENDDVVEANFVNLMSDIKDWSGRFGGGNAHSSKERSSRIIRKFSLIVPTFTFPFGIM